MRKPVVRDMAFFMSRTKPEGECLVWQGSLTVAGYSRFVDMGKAGSGHRAVARLSGLDIEGRVVRHSCHNRACINPEHLSVGTDADNVKDMDNAGRRYRVVTPKTIAAVKALLKEGMRQRDISELLGINQRYVSEIKCGVRGDDGKILKPWW